MPPHIPASSVIYALTSLFPPHSLSSQGQEVLLAAKHVPEAKKEIITEASGSRASHEKPAGAATNATTNSNIFKMSSTLDHVPVRHLTS